jgi:hypothetical protein
MATGMDDTRRVKIGEPAKVVYVRSGERRETTLTPSARK